MVACITTQDLFIYVGPIHSLDEVACLLKACGMEHVGLIPQFAGVVDGKATGLHMNIAVMEGDKATALPRLKNSTLNRAVEIGVRWSD